MCGLSELSEYGQILEPTAGGAYEDVYFKKTLSNKMLNWKITFFSKHAKESKNEHQTSKLSTILMSTACDLWKNFDWSFYQVASSQPLENMLKEVGQVTLCHQRVAGIDKYTDDEDQVAFYLFKKT